MKLELALAHNALKRSKSFTFVFIFNFTLTILGVFTLQFFKDNMKKSLESKSKSILGADLVISSRFPIEDSKKEEILSLVPPIKSKIETVSMMAMVSANEKSRLFQIAQVEQGFPFYGGLKFTDESSYPTLTELPSENEVWIYPEILFQLGIDENVPLKIGAAQFSIKKIIAEDSLKALRFSGFIPRIYMSKKAIEKATILQFGSTANYAVNYQFENQLNNIELEQIEKNLEEKLGRSLNVQSPNDGSDRLVSVMQFISNFLSLISLVSFFLGVIGLIYLYSGFLDKHQKDMNVLSDIGLKKNQILQTYFYHFLLMLTISTVFVFSVLAAISPLIEKIIQSNIQLKIDYAIDYLFFAKGIILIFLFALIIGLPMIWQKLSNKKNNLLIFFPAIIFLIIFSNYIAEVRNIGLWFGLSIVFIISLIYLFGNFFLRKLDRSGLSQNLSFSLACKNIIRKKNSSITIFMALFLTTALFSLIPQIGASLTKALKISSENRPRFFILDIQEDKLPLIQKKVETLGGELQNISPMLRARIINVNDVDFKEFTFDTNTDSNNLENRMVNLSYRNDLRTSETLIEGKLFEGIYQSNNNAKPVQISVEKKYAQRHNLKIADKITFDLLGLEIIGVITNIRSVNWTEFAPNFLLILQDGAINDAPKTILATIPNGNYDPNQMVLKLSDEFPSITVLDIKGIIDEFSKITQSVTNILNKMSYFSIGLGLIMTFIIIQYQMSIRFSDIMRLKMIGVQVKIIKKSLIIEFAALAIFSTVLGLILGSVSSYTISQYLFEGHWDTQILLIWILLFLIPSLIIFVVSTFSNRTIAIKENNLFGESL